MQILNRPRLLSMLALAAVACNNEDFAAKDRKGVEAPPPKIEPGIHALNVPCEGQDKVVKIEKITTSTVGGKVNVTGTLCKVTVPTIEPKSPHVSFLIDYSGSMAKVDPAIGTGADLTCKRYIAAKALYDSLASRFGDQIELVKFAVTVFDSTARALTPGEITASEFVKTLTPATFCTTRPGGTTNYEAAFDEAARLIKPLDPERDKHVFLFTDGLPTRDQTRDCDNGQPQRCEDSGEAAADRLKNKQSAKNPNGIPNGDPKMNINVMFLVDLDQPATDGNKAYLEKIASTPENVKFVKDAKDAGNLVNDIKKVEPQKFEGVVATAHVNGGGLDLNVPVSLTPNGDNTWQFKTDPITIPGKNAEYVLDVVPTAAGVDFGVGSEVKMIVTVK